MSSRRAIVRSVAATLVVFALAGTWACSSKSSNPVAPMMGGGGAKELDSGDFGSGAVFQHRFFTAGSFPYHCIHHTPMTGTVTVSAAAPDTLVAVSIVSNTSPFPAASVKPGGRVVWTNNTGSVHTVTSD